MLQGKKTYISAGVMAALTFLKLAGIIDEQVYQALMALAAATGLAALRASK